MLDDVAIPCVCTDVDFIAQDFRKAAAVECTACGCLVPMRVEITDNVNNPFVGVVHFVDQADGVGIPGDDLQLFVGSQLIAQRDTAAYPFTF